MSLSRQTRCRLERLTHEIDRLIDTDRKFFMRRPDRSYRIRRPFRQEVEVNHLLGMGPAKPDEGRAFYVVIRQVAPGERLRVCAFGPVDQDTDLFSEEDCRTIYEINMRSDPRLWAVESSIEAAL